MLIIWKQITKSILVFSVLFFFTHLSTFSQPYVRAKDNGSLFISAFTSTDNACESVFKNIETIKDSIYFIIDEITCPKGNYFVLLFDEKIYFSRVFHFANIESISKNLIKLRTNIPNFEERITLAKSTIIKFKDSVNTTLQINKRIKDSIDYIVRDSTFKALKKEADSVQKKLRALVDNLGPRRTILVDWSFYAKSKYNDDLYDISITVFNPYRRKIKYIEFTFHAFNPVNDPAIDYRLKTHIRTLRGVGPIEPLNRAEYEFESAYYTSVLNKIKLKSIKVIFFDGSSTIISDPIPFDTSVDEFEF